MAGKAKAQIGKTRAMVLIRDKHGKPKVDKEKFKEFEQFLSDDDKLYLKERYKKDGNHTS